MLLNNYKNLRNALKPHNYRILKYIHFSYNNDHSLKLEKSAIQADYGIQDPIKTGDFY